MSTLMSLIILVSGVIVTVAVTMMDGQERGMTTFAPAEPIWGSNRGRGKQAALKRITIVATFVMMASTLGLLISL